MACAASPKDKPDAKEPAAGRRVNPEMIILGRELRGLTQADLARQLKATQGKISKLEDGFLGVSTEDLEKHDVRAASCCAPFSSGRT